MVRQHTLQGTFCDPYYGGNTGFVGWDILSYPGIRMSVSEQDEALNAESGAGAPIRMIFPCLIAAKPPSPIAFPHRWIRPICLTAWEMIPKNGH